MTQRDKGNTLKLACVNKPTFKSRPPKPAHTHAEVTRGAQRGQDQLTEPVRFQAKHMIFSFLRLVVFLSLGATFLIMTDVTLDVSGKITPQETTPSNFTGFPRSFSLPALKSWFQQCRESIKPWGLFINTSHFKVPPSFPRLLKRAVNNLSYFQGNYLMITLILMAYTLLTSPLLLLSVAASLIGCYMLSVRNNERKLYISGKEISLNQQYAAVGICSLPLYYWAGVGQAVFWVIGASCFVISIHAGLFNIDEVMSQEDQLDLIQDVTVQVQ